MKSKTPTTIDRTNHFEFSFKLLLLLLFFFFGLWLETDNDIRWVGRLAIYLFICLWLANFIEPLAQLCVIRI